MLFLSFRITPWRDEKSVKSTTCGSKISRLRLEMKILWQPPKRLSRSIHNSND